MGRPITCECGECETCKARVRKRRQVARDKLEAEGLGPLARKGEVITPVAVQPDMAEVVDAVDGLDDAAEAVLLERMARRREMAAIAAGERPSGATLALIALRPDASAPLDTVRDAFDKQFQGWLEDGTHAVDGERPKPKGRKARRAKREAEQPPQETPQQPEAGTVPSGDGCPRCGGVEIDTAAVLGSTMAGTWLQARCRACRHEWRRLWKYPR